MNADPLRERWMLDPEITFLNHGSFGACPRAVLARQAALREQLEREPVRFMQRELLGLLDASRERLARFVDADPEGLGFVTNATSAVNAVLRSLRFAEGDQLLVTDHAYPACRHALHWAAETWGAEVVVVPLPFHGATEEELVRRLVEAAGPRTRLALVDHVTSATGMVLPVARIVAELDARGIDTLVDGAHAPGMVEVSLRTLGAAYYAANCHKWICAPKGAAFLHVREDRREPIHPLTISHGFRPRPSGRSRFRQEFDWQGSADMTPWVCVADALDEMAGMVDGGWSAVRDRNRRLALEARSLLCDALGLEPPFGEELIGTLVSLPLPDRRDAPDPALPGIDPLQDALLFEHGIEVPILPFPAPPARLLRVSAQLYNTGNDYSRLADLLPGLLAGAA